MTEGKPSQGYRRLDIEIVTTGRNWDPGRDRDDIFHVLLVLTVVRADANPIQPKNTSLGTRAAGNGRTSHEGVQSEAPQVGPERQENTPAD